MAYNSKAVEEVICTVKKESSSPILIKTLTDKDKNSVKIDIRTHFTPEGKEELAPTSKGVRFDSEELLDVVKALVSQLQTDELDEVADLIDDIKNEEAEAGSEAGSEASVEASDEDDGFMRV